MSNSAMTIIKQTALSAAVLSAAIASGTVFSSAADAQTASATTNVNFKVNPFVRLYYKDTVNITVSPKPESEAIGQKDFSMDATYNPDSALTGEGDVALNANTANASGKITLKNFWAVQSIATKSTEVTWEVKESTAKHKDQPSSIKVSGSGKEVFDPTGLAGVKYGDATLDVDLKETKHAGDYTGATVVISATNL